MNAVVFFLVGSEAADNAPGTREILAMIQEALLHGALVTLALVSIGYMASLATGRPLDVSNVITNLSALAATLILAVAGGFIVGGFVGLLPHRFRPRTGETKEQIEKTGYE